MSLRGFGRVTPIQMAMLRLAGEDVLRGGPGPVTDIQRVAAMKKGRESLMQRTGVDFRYDIAAWRAFLLADAKLSEEYTFQYGWKAVQKKLDERIHDPDHARLAAMCEEGSV
jgi:hypothetical protein